MQIQYHNCPKPEPFNAALLPKDLPAFLSYEPAWHQMDEFAKAYGHYKQFLVIGYGGSYTSLFALYDALRHEKTKPIHFLHSQDPDYITHLKFEMTDKQDTLVIAISKSGQDVTQVEGVLQFLDYPLLFITTPASPLGEIAKRLNAKVFPHPVIGGRFTGLTEVSLLPLLLAGIAVKSIFKGGRELHEKFSESNDAYTMASIFWQLEQQEYKDVLVGLYSQALAGYAPVIMQLAHETFGKQGHGQTYFATEGPEVQHHTLQRFFGGPKNIAGIFMTQASFRNLLFTDVPAGLQQIQIKDQHLYALSKIPLAEAMKFEAESNVEAASIAGIPTLSVTLPNMSEHTAGQLLAFWQMFAVYSALLRGVNPFDQPEVEKGKQISFAKRLAFRNIR